MAGVTYTRLMPILAGQTAIYPCGATLGQALQQRTEIMRTLPLVGMGNFLLTIVFAAVLGGLIGYLASYPALRLKDEWFLGLVLLAASEVVRIIVRGHGTDHLRTQRPVGSFPALCVAARHPNCGRRPLRR